MCTVPNVLYLMPRNKYLPRTEIIIVVLIAVQNQDDQNTTYILMNHALLVVRTIIVHFDWLYYYCGIYFIKLQFWSSFLSVQIVLVKLNLSFWLKFTLLKTCAFHNLNLSFDDEVEHSHLCTTCGRFLKWNFCRSVILHLLQSICLMTSFGLKLALVTKFVIIYIMLFTR